MTISWFKLHRLTIGTLALVAVSCGGDDAVTPTEGSIRIQTSTSGSDLDSDGYSVRLNEEDALAIEPSGEVLIENVGLGRYTVTLTGLAANCTTATGENPQTVDVVGGETVTVGFEITCVPVDGGGGGPTD